MAGYSGTPLAAKLGIKAGSVVALVEAPPAFAATLEPLPPGVRFVTPGAEPIDVMVFFTAWRGNLLGLWPELTAAMQPAGGLWLAWPKKSAKLPGDITEDTLRELLLPTGWVDNKVCAISETLSGLRFVLRKELRPKP